MLWSLTADRRRPGSLAQSVEMLGLSARAVRDQMSNNTWTVLASGGPRGDEIVGRATGVQDSRRPVDDGPRTQDVDGHAGARRGGRRVHGARCGLGDDGYRQTYRTRYRAGCTAGREWPSPVIPAPSRPSPRSALVACESLIIYRRRTAGQFNVAAMADLCFSTPRSAVADHQWIGSRNLRTLPGSSGSRPERLVDEDQRPAAPVDLAELENVGPGGERIELRGPCCARCTPPCGNCPPSSPTPS